MAGVAIRQIVSALFERVSKSTEEACGEGVELGAGPKEAAEDKGEASSDMQLSDQEQGERVQRSKLTRGSDAL